MSNDSLEVFDTEMSLETKSQLAQMESLAQHGGSTMVVTYLREQRQPGSNPRSLATSTDQASLHHSEWTGTSVNTYTNQSRPPSVTTDNGAHLAVHHEEYFSPAEFPLDLGTEGTLTSEQEQKGAAKKEPCTDKKKVRESLPNCTKTFIKQTSIPSESTRSRSSSASAVVQVCAATVNRILSSTSSPVSVANTLSHVMQCSPLTRSLEPDLEDSPTKLIKTQKLMINRSKLMDFVKYNRSNECFRIGPTKTKLPLGCRKNPRLRLSLCSSECRSDGALTLVINVYFPGRCSAVVTNSIIRVKLTLVNPQNSTTINSETVLFALNDRTITVNKFFPYAPLCRNSDCVAFELRMEVSLCDFFPDIQYESSTKIKESQLPDGFDSDMINIVTVAQKN